VFARKRSDWGDLLEQLRLLDKPNPNAMTWSESWANDPDCFGDNCDGLSMEEVEDPKSYACWACRNPDHFSSNGLACGHAVGDNGERLHPSGIFGIVDKTKCGREHEDFVEIHDPLSH
jgi:hypothetical protein